MQKQDIISKVNVHHVYDPLPPSMYDNKSICTFLQKCLDRDKIINDSKPGDLVVHVPSSGYRMQGVFIIDCSCNSNIVIPLDSQLDDCGSIPPQFTCPKYTPDAILSARTHLDKFYWHNSFVPLDLTKFILSYDRHKNKFVSVVHGYTYIFDNDFSFIDNSQPFTYMEYHPQSTQFINHHNIYVLKPIDYGY